MWANGKSNSKGWVQNNADPYDNSGTGDTSARCAEMDLLEANKAATAFVTHIVKFESDVPYQIERHCHPVAPDIKLQPIAPDIMLQHCVPQRDIVPIAPDIMLQPLAPHIMRQSGPPPMSPKTAAAARAAAKAAELQSLTTRPQYLK